MSKFLKSPIVAGVAVLALAATGMSVIATGALSKSNVTVSPNTFVAGNIELTKAGTVVPFTVTGMMPGDVYYKSIPLTNTGDATLRYAMTAVTGSSDLLIEKMQINVKNQLTAGECQAGAGFDADPTLSGPLPLGDVTVGHVLVLGDAAVGAQPGDRELVAGQTDNLCVQVAYPIAPDNSTFDGQSAEAVFAFSGEQVANNP